MKKNEKMKELRRSKERKNNGRIKRDEGNNNERIKRNEITMGRSK
jgi:hypothetical protein